MRNSTRGFGRHAAPSTVRYAVVGIAQACIPDPDARLRKLLAGAIADSAAVIDRARTGAAGATSSVDHERWAAACRLTGVTR